MMNFIRTNVPFLSKLSEKMKIIRKKSPLNQIKRIKTFRLAFMNRLKDCGVLPLTPRESAHRRYREDLKRYKQIYGQYRWDLLVTIRQGKGEQFHSFTNHKDDGYRKREDFAKSFLGRVRCSLSLGKRQFHYCIFHEFGEHLSGHLHIPVQIDAQRPIERIENVLNKEARH